MDIRHNYVKVIRTMIEEGKIPQDITLSKLDIYHDDGCSIFTGGFCTCAPVVEHNPFVETITLEDGTEVPL